jgi:hypothetical protein
MVMILPLQLVFLALSFEKQRNKIKRVNLSSVGLERKKSKVLKLHFQFG